MQAKLRNNTKFFKQKLIIINVCALYKFVLSIMELSSFLNRVGKVFTNIHYFLFLSFLKSFFSQVLGTSLCSSTHRDVSWCYREPYKIHFSHTSRECVRERESGGVELGWSGIGTVRVVTSASIILSVLNFVIKPLCIAFIPDLWCSIGIYV